MRILVIGASGPIGRAVVEELSKHHQLVKAGRSHGDFRVDIRNRESVSQLFREVGMLDAIVCAAGHVHFDPLDKMNSEKFQVGLQDKLMGQVNLSISGTSISERRRFFYADQRKHQRDSDSRWDK